MATRWKPESATGSTPKSANSSHESSPTPSFCTASETAGRDDDVVTTAKTSPDQFANKPQASAPDTPMGGYDDLDDGPEDPAGDGGLPPYRPAKKLPREVREHCKIYLEEELYSAAIEMLASLMSAGGHRPRSKQRPALLPPPNQLAFLASLAIHPLYTNRPTEAAHRTIGAQAMQYLRGLLGSAGPVHANFRAAFDFEPWRRQGRRALSAVPADEEDEAMGGRFAQGHIVFSRAESFWRLLGWALNCSALHPERWRYWEVWLGFMADVLDADWRERTRLDGGQGGGDWRSGSLLLRYVRDMDRAAVKGMVRALFADGSAASLREFPELYEREAMARTTDGGGGGGKRKRAPSSDLDLANDKFGDYFDDDGLSSQGSAPDSPTRPTAAGSRQKRTEEAPPPSEELVASVGLRLRFFNMVGHAFDFLDSAECQRELFTAFSNSLRSLPVPLYELYVAPHRTEMDPRSQVSLLLDAVGTFRPASAPKPGKVDREAADGGFVNMLIMEKCYLPFAVTATAEANAKFSLVLESLFRVLWVNGQVCHSAELDEAVRAGVALRNERSKPKKAGRSRDRAEEAARAILARSGARLEYLMGIVREEKSDDGDAVSMEESRPS